MGSVKKEKNGTWTAMYSFYTDGKRTQKKRRGFLLKADATTFLNAVENEILTHAYIVPSDSRFTEYAAGFIKQRYTDKVDSGRISFKTDEYYKNLFNDRFEKYFEGRLLNQITPRDIEKYLEFLVTQKWKNGKRRVSDKTVCKHFKAIRTLFNYAIKKKTCAGTHATM